MPKKASSRAEVAKLQLASVRPILLAEDSPDDEFLFLDLIRRSRITNPVIVVRDGTEAIACLKGEGPFADTDRYPLPSVLFLDLKMPKVNGIEVLQWVKTQPHLQDLVRIILTHHQNVKDVNLAYELGAHSFLTKPFTQEELCNLVQHYGTHFDGCCGQEFPIASPRMDSRVSQRPETISPNTDIG